MKSARSDGGEGRRAYRPRDLGVRELVVQLVKEHGVMKEGLTTATEAASAGDFVRASKALRQVDDVFRQHIADEEATLLRLLVGELGVEGAEAEIRVFRQHRPIYRLMQRVGEMAAMTSDELRAVSDELGSLLAEHTLAEEARVYPKAETLADRRKGAARGA